jgi:hypothetical protein
MLHGFLLKMKICNSKVCFNNTVYKRTDGRTHSEHNALSARQIAVIMHEKGSAQYQQQLKVFHLPTLTCFLWKVREIRVAFRSASRSSKLCCFALNTNSVSLKPFGCIEECGTMTIFVIWYNDHLHNVLLEKKNRSLGSTWKQRGRIGRSVVQKQISRLFWCTVTGINVKLVLSVSIV